MPSFRFSLLTLFWVVTAIAVGCAGLANPSKTWATAIGTIALASLLFAVLAAIYTEPAKRAFWIGFAVVGWGHLVVQQFNHIPEMPTRHSLRLVDFASASDEHVTHPLLQGMEWFGPARSIVYWIFLMFLSFVGGLVARHLYLRRERQSPK